MRLASRDTAPESHQERPETLETFQTSHASGKVKWVSLFFKTMLSEIAFLMTLTIGAFVKQKPNKQTSHE